MRPLLFVALLFSSALLAQSDANSPSVGNGPPGDSSTLDSIDSLGFSQFGTMSGAGVTCSAGIGASALTLNPTCAAPGAYVVAPIVNSDVDGCAVTLSEAAAQLGCVVIIELSSSSGGVVTVADTANVLDVDGSWTPTVGDNLRLVYEDLANDAWQETGRNKSWNSANDGSGSGLDADFLDGASSAAYAVVAGGNAFASSNTYAADDLTDADVSNTLTCSLFVGSGSSTTAIDLATAEVSGTLPVANVNVTTLCGIAGGSVCPTTPTTTTYGASTALDFDSTSLTTVTLTGNITFTTSNLSAGETLTVRIVGDGSIRTFVFPAWKFVGAAAPASLAANKVAILSLVSFSTTDASVVASYAAEP